MFAMKNENLGYVDPGIIYRGSDMGGALSPSVHTRNALDRQKHCPHPSVYRREIQAHAFPVFRSILIYLTTSIATTTTTTERHKIRIHVVVAVVVVVIVVVVELS